MLFDDKTKGIAQAYLSMLEQNNNLNESHYKVGERVKCKKSGMLGKVTKVDPKGEGKYYTVKQDSGREMTFAPDELTSVSADVKEASCNTKKEAIEIVMPKKSKVDDDEEDDEDEDEMEDDDEVKIKVKDDKSDKKAKMTEALKGNQHKLDKNNNGKLDAQDFKMLKGKKVKEDVEQVDEVSKRTLGSYVKKAAHDAVIQRKIGADFENLAKKARKPGMKSSAQELEKQYTAKSRKRRAGINTAVDRLTKEDVEQMEEGTYKRMATDAEEDKRLSPGSVTDKSGAVHSPMSRVKHIAQMAMKKKGEELKKQGMKEDVEQVVESNLVHVSDGSKYNMKPHPKDVKHVMDGVKKYSGKNDGSTDKGSVFKFNSKNDAADFVRHVSKAPHRSVDADLTESTVKDIAKAAEMRAGSVMKPKAPPVKTSTQSSIDSIRTSAEKRKQNESFVWDWDAILEAPEDEINSLIDQLSEEDFDSFVGEFDTLEEGNWYQGSTNSKQPMDANGRETLDPRAQADRAFSDAHRQTTDVKDYPGKDKPVTNAKPQAPLRPGDKRNSEPKKTLSDIRNK